MSPTPVQIWSSHAFQKEFSSPKVIHWDISNSTVQDLHTTRRAASSTHGLAVAITNRCISKFARHQPSPQCCAQRASVRRMVVEALLIAIFLLKERADSYRHRKYNRRVILPIPSFSWSCQAESVTASPISLYLLGRRRLSG
jgi:hypothetical protein